MNILLLAVGTRNKIVQYFKRAWSGTGQVIATDSSILAPAIYEADRYYIVPPITAPDYLDVILDICKKEKITGLLSLIDPELSLLAEHEETFRSVGATVIGSPFELCEMSLDKMQMYHWLKNHHYLCAQSWDDPEAFYQDAAAQKATYPVIVKPVQGSASLNLSKANDWETVRLLTSHQDHMMVQEYLDGQEIGADVYIDLISGEVVSIFTKKKIKMRAGETDKAVSFKENRLFELIEKFVKEAGFRGQIDIDLFEKNGEYYISEVNPRFGGGYPHAYEAGCDHIQLIRNNLQGKVNEKRIGEYDENVYMMKYNEVSIRKKLP